MLFSVTFRKAGGEIEKRLITKHTLKLNNLSMRIPGLDFDTSYVKEISIDES